jgi:hypothetical protein
MVLGLWLVQGAPRGAFAAIEVEPESVPKPRIALAAIDIQAGLGPDGAQGFVGRLANHGRSTAWAPVLRDTSGTVYGRAIPDGGSVPFFAATQPTGFGAETEPPVAGAVTTDLEAVQVRLDPENGSTVVSGRIQNRSRVGLRDVRIAVLARDAAGRPVAVAVGTPDLDDGILRYASAEPFRVTLPPGTGPVEDVSITADALQAP